MPKVHPLCLVGTEIENLGTRPSDECGTILLSHLVDAQSALRPDQPTGCLASLYAAARSKTIVDRERLVATTMTGGLSATTGLATASCGLPAKATGGLRKIRASSFLSRKLFTRGRPRSLCPHPQPPHGFFMQGKSHKPS